MAVTIGLCSLHTLTTVPLPIDVTRTIGERCRDDRYGSERCENGRNGGNTNPRRVVVEAQSDLAPSAAILGSSSLRTAVSQKGGATLGVRVQTGQSAKLAGLAKNCCTRWPDLTIIR